MSPGPGTMDHRGTGFSGIGEALAALAVAVGVLTIDPGIGADRALLTAALVLCLLAGTSGRWPYLGALGTSAMLALVLALADGGSADIGLAYLTPYIVVQAVATTGRWWWVAAITFTQLVLWWVLTPVPTSPNVLFAELLFTVMTVPVGLGLGLGQPLSTMLTYSRSPQGPSGEALGLRLTRRSYEIRALEDLAAMRRDIARDLHDSIAHDVTVMVLLAGRARDKGGRDTEVGQHLNQIVTTGQQSIRDLHTMLAVLRRQSPDDGRDKLWDLGGPEVELERSRQRLRSAGFVDDVRAVGSLTGLPGLVAEVLAKCTAEAVSNVIRHGERGTTCTIRLEVAEQAELVVINTVAQRPAGSGTGLGLVGMRERVEAVGGVTEAGPRGTDLFAVEIAIPLEGRVST